MPAFPFSSPIRSISKFTNSQHSHVHLVPKLVVESHDHFLLSESFTGLVDDDIATFLLFPDAPETQRKVDMITDLSYDAEIKEDFAPHFRDGEIEEVMVISPTQKPTHSFREDVKINDFRLFHALSKNSNSSIYLCRKCDLKLYAMRISNKDSERLPTRTPHEYIQYQREIFREIRELQSFFLSPFIWSYEDGLEIRSIAEFYHHGSLQNLLDRDTNLSENLTLQLASEMVEALHTLHTAGIIHRDLAPCNIMFDVSGHIVITGFGQACRPHSTVSFPLHDTGSYCAPELILAWAHGFSVDCWSFGVLLYMMLFGSHPFVAKDENENVAITHANIIHSSLIIPNTKSISWAAQDLIINCLERNAALRLDIGQIKAHVYFGTMNWKNVTDRIANAPLVYNNEDPVNDTQHTQLTDNVTVSEAQKVVLPEAEPLTLAEEKLVDLFTHVPQRIVKFRSGSLGVHQDPILQTQRHISSQTTRLEIIPEVSDEEESLDERDLESSTKDRLQCHRRRSAANPEPTPGPLSFWDTLDLEVNSHHSQASTAGRDESRTRFGMLRKSRSVTFQDGLPISITSTVPSAVRNKLRKRMRPASTPTLRSPHLDPLPNDLPVGVEQIGLGFSPMEPIASRSKSVYRSAIRACQNLVPAIRRKISRQSLRKQEQSTSTSVDSNSIQDAMGVTHEIYDPTWASGVESSPATNTPSATTFESEEPVTPETPCFDHTVGIVQHNTFSTLRLVPSSGLQLST